MFQKCIPYSCTYRVVYFSLILLLKIHLFIQYLTHPLFLCPSYNTRLLFLKDCCVANVIKIIIFLMSETLKPINNKEHNHQTTFGHFFYLMSAVVGSIFALFFLLFLRVSRQREKYWNRVHCTIESKLQIRSSWRIFTQFFYSL